jgi:Domain of unknown function (DUF4349)
MQILGRRGIAPRLVLFLTVIAVLAAACSGSTAAPAPNGGDAAAGAYNGAGVPQAAASAAPSIAASEPGSGTTGSGGNGGTALVADTLKIVYTGSLDLVVGDLQPALAQAKTAVIAAGGYIGASEESNDGTRPTAVITYRIPATRWEDVIGSLRGLATKVVAEKTQATEVGGQIVDLEARIANLRASESALQDIAKSTAKVTDLLAVQQQLSDVRGQIEQLDGQRAQLVDQVAYGTLVTTFGLQVEAVQVTAKGWNPASEVDAAAATLIGVGQALASAGIWFGIVGLPGLIVLAVILLIGRLLWKRFGPKMPVHGPVDGWNAG